MADKEPTPAMLALSRAHHRAPLTSAPQAILWAAWVYADKHPEWFDGWHELSPAVALIDAYLQAELAEHWEAAHGLRAAYHVARDNPQWFDGANQ